MNGNFCAYSFYPCLGFFYPDAALIVSHCPAFVHTKSNPASMGSEFNPQGRKICHFNLQVSSDQLAAKWRERDSRPRTVGLARDGCFYSQNQSLFGNHTIKFSCLPVRKSYFALLLCCSGVRMISTLYIMSKRNTQCYFPWQVAM